ncbi:glycosyltransferase [Sedimenticola hydrogenitrophicus]|uniref:glycosyltransferase n=1 Tax=Sedimenticola hydrogenitrophicus TaxID=2967975 RepID=UPI0023AED7B1|nr:glycosyltransferase [Sedimenticola hydrogenitrophicus]
MKVCHFIASRGLGRGEFYVDLVNELSGLCDITLMIPAGARYLNRVSSAVSVCQYQHKNSRKNPLLLWELGKQFKSLKPDIVHTHFGKATGIFRFLNRVLHLPHVATKHNPRKGRVFDRVAHVIAVSDQVRETIKNPHVHVIHNAITPVPITHRKCRPARFTLMAVGRLDPIKGFDLLLKDIARLEFDFLLKIIGSGAEKQHLMELVSTLGLAGRVELLGFREDIPQQLNEADLVVISSRSEGGPVVALETLFYGNLLISTPVGIVPEILPADLLVEQGGFAKKIEQVYRDYAHYAQLFSRLQQTHQRDFLLSTIAAQHIGLYSDMLGCSMTSEHNKH